MVTVKDHRCPCGVYDEHCEHCIHRDDYIEYLRNAECGKCGRSLPPDGDCYGCESDRLTAELAEAKHDAENGWMLARSWEKKADDALNEIEVWKSVRPDQDKDRRIAELEADVQFYRDGIVRDGLDPDELRARIAELDQELFEERMRKQDAETCHQIVSDDCRRLEAELAEAWEKQRLDQMQCDEMTSEAGKMAVEISRLEAELAEVRKKYTAIIMEVASKVPGEKRWETARRIIREREARYGCGEAQSAAIDDTKGGE